LHRRSISAEPTKIESEKINQNLPIRMKNGTTIATSTETEAKKIFPLSDSTNKVFMNRETSSQNSYLKKNENESLNCETSQYK
jgi:hypothetical protein